MNYFFGINGNRVKDIIYNHMGTLTIVHLFMSIHHKQILLRNWIKWGWNGVKCCSAVYITVLCLSTCFCLHIHVVIVAKRCASLLWQLSPVTAEPSDGRVIKRLCLWNNESVLVNNVNCNQTLKYLNQKVSIQVWFETSM